jgi:uncharacterized protein (TIGR03437 family)
MRLLLVFAAAAPLFAQTSCPDSLSPSPSLSIPGVSYPGVIAVRAGYDCTWTYSTASPWITFTSGPAKGIGSGADYIGWSAAANVTPYSRQASIIVTGATGNSLTLTISQAGAICAITLPQPSTSIGVSGGSGAFQVLSNCTWSASAQSWIAVTVPPIASGTTNGAVNYTVAANPCATARTGAVSVTGGTANQQFQVNQDGSPGNFSISATSTTVPPVGATNTIYVTTGAGCVWSAKVDVSWIKILSGSSGSSNGGIGYSVPANTGPQRTGHITVQPGPWVLTVTQQAVPLPTVQLSAVVNAASNVAGAVSPGEIVTLYGVNMGPTSPVSLQLVGDGSSISKSIGGTRVLFDGVPTGLIYTSATQVNAVSPYGLAGATTTQVQVEYQGVLSNAMPVPVQAAHPGLFTVDASGQGGGAILNQDSSLNGSLNLAATGSVVMIYSTGGGVTTPASVDAAITPAPPPLYLLKTSPVAVTIGGIAATVSYSGAAPSQIAGLTQINAQVPAGLTPGTKVPVIVTIGTWQSQPGVTMAVK